MRNHHIKLFIIIIFLLATPKKDDQPPTEILVSITIPNTDKFNEVVQDCVAKIKRGY
jgi:hypothetical protein